MPNQFNALSDQWISLIQVNVGLLPIFLIRLEAWMAIYQMHVPTEIQQSNI